MPHTTGSEHPSSGSPWGSLSSDVVLQVRPLRPREEKAWPTLYLVPPSSQYLLPPALSPLLFSPQPPPRRAPGSFLSLSLNPFLLFFVSLRLTYSSLSISIFVSVRFYLHLSVLSPHLCVSASLSLISIPSFSPHLQSRNFSVAF